MSNLCVMLDTQSYSIVHSTNHNNLSSTSRSQTLKNCLDFILLLFFNVIIKKKNLALKITL